MSHTGAIEYNSAELDFLTQINNSDAEFIKQWSIYHFSMQYISTQQLKFIIR